MTEKKDILYLGDKVFDSRFFIGTGKYPSNDIMMESINKSGASIVTVALRRVDLENIKHNIWNDLRYYKGLVLPNTSGASNVEEAIRLAKIGASMLGHKWVKLEVVPDPSNLLPDPIGTYEAAKILVKDGFSVMPYINTDPILAKRLEEVGCVCVMPLGSLIGSNMGIIDKEQLQIIIDHAIIPVVVDAGIGAPSDASLAMEMGADAVLVNTAIATAGDPVGMACAFGEVIKASRRAYFSKLSHKVGQARASSPLTGFLSE